MRHAGAVVLLRIGGEYETFSVARLLFGHHFIAKDVSAFVAAGESRLDQAGMLGAGGAIRRRPQLRD